MDNEFVATHYNERKDEGREGRKRSRIYHLRQFNNWLKSVLIKLHARPGYAVLDLCCGKGGDLQKWAAVDCTTYFACDVAEVSVKVAMERYNGLREAPFRPVLYVCDCFAVPLTDILPPDAVFDVVSCQFAIHYAFASEDRVRMLLRNVADRLRDGGFFIGTTVDANVLVRKLRAVDASEVSSSIYNVKLDERFSSKHFTKGNPYGVRYFFTLDQNVEDCPEYLVHFPSFEKLALEYDLELMMLCNFHDFFKSFVCAEHAQFRDLFFNMNVVNESGTMSAEEWDAIYLYTAFAFRKRGIPNEGMELSETIHRQIVPLAEREITIVNAGHVV